MDAGPYEASGRLMAQQALAHLESDGQITIITRDTSTFKNPASDIQLASFRRTIDQAHATIASIRKLKVDPLRPIAVPSAEFREAILNTSPGGVIVSFMGLPVLTDADRARIGQDRPPIVAFCSGDSPKLPEIRSLFQQGLLQAVVLDRHASDRPAAVPLSQTDRGDQSFVTLTATNFAEAVAWKGDERK
jgi:hypothetical protein